MDRNFRGAGLLEFLDTRVYSGDEGIGKPDPRIFHLAAERAGVAGRPILYMGNSVRADIEGGRGAGWSTALFRSSESTSSGLADFEIDAWSELPGIVLG
jgi:putative hydrolase of the HAD superfamily